MTVRVYRSTDGSAPAASQAVGALITLLDAVLVNGYGAKSAAGWTKQFSGTNQAMYKNGTGSSGATLFVDDTAVDVAPVYGTVNPTSISSTANQFGTPSQSRFNKAGSAWVIVADESSFYYFSRRSNWGLSWSGVFFGDILSFVTGDVGRCLLVPSASAATTLPTNEPLVQVSTYNTTTAQHFMAGVHNGYGFCAAGKAQSAIVTNNLPTPYQLNGGFSIRRPLIAAVTSSYVFPTPRGYMPGLWFYNHNQTNVYVQDGATFTPTGRLTGKTLENFTVYDPGSSPVYQNILIETSDTWVL